MSEYVRKYLKEMDIPENVIDKMFSIRSDEILYLDNATVESLERVPFFDEWIRAECKEPTKEEKDQQLKLLHEKKITLENYFQIEKQEIYNECHFKKLLEAQTKRKFNK
jgi:hypothetical protein